MAREETRKGGWMRRIYLIRHAMPDFPAGQKMCCGWADIPLGAVGRMQAVLLERYMADYPVTQVFCSDLSRSVQTARYLTDAPRVLPGLREMGAGDWDGLSFDVIRQRWPEIYERRGREPGYPIPGAEDVRAGQARFCGAVEQALAESRGDIVIVGHSTVNQSLICRAMGVEPGLGRQFRLGYGSVTEVDYDGQFHVARMNLEPHPALDTALCEKLLEAAGTPERVVCHCRGVAVRAAQIAGALASAGVELDMALVNAGAMLHDIARGWKKHPKVGAQWLQELGYPEIGEILECHHDLSPGTIDEKTVVFLADKGIKGTAPVTVEERFEHSLAKCIGGEALAAHEKRRQDTIKIRDQINRICGKAVVL